MHCPTRSLSRSLQWTPAKVAEHDYVRETLTWICHRSAARKRRWCSGSTRARQRAASGARATTASTHGGGHPEAIGLDRPADDSAGAVELAVRAAADSVARERARDASTASRRT